MVERADAPGGKMREVAGRRRAHRRRADRVHDALGVRGDLRQRRRDAGGALCACRRSKSWRATPGARRQRLDLFADIDRSADAIAALRRRRPRRGAIVAFCARARADLPTRSKRPFIRARGRARWRWCARPGCAGSRDLCRHRAVRDPVARARRALPRPAPAPAVRPLRHLLRLVAVPGAGHADAGRARRAGRRLAGRGRHAPRWRRRWPASPQRARRRPSATARSATEVVAARRHGARGVRLASGERLAADAVVVNGDVAALSQRACSARGARARAPGARRALRVRCRR